MSPGSLLFPFEGPSAAERFYRTFITPGGQGDNRNIYMLLYDTLSKEPEARLDQREQHLRINKNKHNNPLNVQNVGSVTENQPDNITKETRLLNTEHNSNELLSQKQQEDNPTHSRRMDTSSTATEQTNLTGNANAVDSQIVQSEHVIMGHAHEHHHSQQHQQHYRRQSYLSWLAPDDVLIFMDFMMSIGVCIGTGSLLCFHCFLCKYFLTY